MRLMPVPQSPPLPGEPGHCGYLLSPTAVPPRVDPDEVAADPLLAEVARTLADLHSWGPGQDLVRWLDGGDHASHARREFIADLIDAHHTLEWRRRWTAVLAGAAPRSDDEDEPWLIDRPWRTR